MRKPQYGDLVRPPTPERSAAGWDMTVWMIDGRDLVRHRLSIAADGTVEDSQDVVETDIPVPVSI